MRTFRLFTLIICVALMSSCETLRTIANDKIDDRRVGDKDNPSGYNCTLPSSATFEESFEIVKDKIFDEEKMRSAKRETLHLKCIKSSQIRRIAELFPFEEEQLAYIKFAYKYCADPENCYAALKSLFDFDDEAKEELEKLTRG